MLHTGTKVLDTPRLTLRRLLPADAQMMYDNWSSDAAVTRWLRWDPHKSADETRAMLAAWAELYPNPDYYQWAIEEKATGQVFGSICLSNTLLDEPQGKVDWAHFDTHNGVWEPGYCIGKAWWGKGYTAEALQAVVQYWFTCTDADWLACSHAVQNIASGRVMEKAGFVYDHNSMYRRFDGTRMPCRCYALTRQRYDALYGRKDLF